jgi:uncharacterized protein (TIGR02117 family)
MGEGKTKRVRSRRRNSKTSLFARVLTAILFIPAAYMLAALIGSLVPVNGAWDEADDGTTVYLANNGVHVDIVMPVRAQGLDWEPFVPKSDFTAADPGAQWVAFGSGEERVYLETPRWRDLTPRAAWSALTGGKRVMHVEWISNPVRRSERAIRLRPEEYRRLWAAIRADFEIDDRARPVRVDHPGYGRSDAFYWSSAGRFSAISTCNTWVADKLRIAGVEASVWPPFPQGLTWRYRRVDQST